MRPAPAKTIDAYIASFPKEAQVMMKQLRSTIKAASPKAREIISYDIPFYEYKAPGYKGRMMYFGGFKTHVSVFVVPRKIPPALAKQVEKYKVAKSTLRFPIGTKIPVAMIKQLVKLRMKEIDQSLQAGSLDN